MIQCKRVYDPQESSDGYRVLVDRLWPRGIKKEALACDEWCKELTPSAELRKAFHGEAIDFAHFSQRYRQELDAHRETGLAGAAPAPPPPPTQGEAGKKTPHQKSPGFCPRRAG
ncbi:DUF488 domain-containing protein, partial [Klebsiella pneumoniae]|uniref:DUF488 domain-containing protein n=1 Tax=Klebsiella pneumoniae TaxID=573 RepID=UPI003D651303